MILKRKLILRFFLPQFSIADSFAPRNCDPRFSVIKRLSRNRTISGFSMRKLHQMKSKDNPNTVNESSISHHSDFLKFHTLSDNNFLTGEMNEPSRSSCLIVTNEAPNATESAPNQLNKTSNLTCYSKDTSPQEKSDFKMGRRSKALGSRKARRRTLTWRAVGNLRSVRSLKACNVKKWPKKISV